MVAVVWQGGGIEEIEEVGGGFKGLCTSGRVWRSFREWGV